MIKVNLVPIDELENQFWWVADAAILLLVAGSCFFGAQWYLGEIQKNVDETAARAQSLEDNARALEPEIERFKDLRQKKTALNEKLDSLRKITVTKISKYQPVIVLEHFQNLKPEGIWFKTLKIDVPRKGVFSVTGQGLDNLLISEFITGMRSTETQEKDDADLRTHVYFSNLLLNRTVISADGGGRFPEMVIYPQFELSGLILEKGGNDFPVGIGDPGISLRSNGLPPISANGSKSKTRANKARF